MVVGHPPAMVAVDSTACDSGGALPAIDSTAYIARIAADCALGDCRAAFPEIDTAPKGGPIPFGLVPGNRARDDCRVA